MCFIEKVWRSTHCQHYIDDIQQEISVLQHQQGQVLTVRKKYQIGNIIGDRCHKKPEVEPTILKISLSYVYLSSW